MTYKVYTFLPIRYIPFDFTNIQLFRINASRRAQKNPVPRSMCDTGVSTDTNIRQPLR